jgi:hypothetical protein
LFGLKKTEPVSQKPQTAVIKLSLTSVAARKKANDPDAQAEQLVEKHLSIVAALPLKKMAPPFLAQQCLN